LNRNCAIILTFVICSFAYVDYHVVESATKAIRAPDKHMLDGRKARVEFGSAEAHMRSKPWLMREKDKANQPQQSQSTDSAAAAAPAESTGGETREYKREEGTSEPYPKRQRGDADFRERRPKKPVSHERVKPGQALYAAQRQKPSVQEFKGSKTVFD
jgi:RNA recognition motif-containing protein